MMGSGTTAPEKAKPEAAAPETQQDPTPVPPADDGRIDKLVALVEQQAEMISAMTTQMAARAVETEDRERAAAELALSQKLPPTHDEVEGTLLGEDGETVTRLFDNEAKCREAGFTPVDVVVFRSRGDAFRVVRVGRNRWTAPNGAEQTTAGRDYQFTTKGLGLSELRVRNSDVAEFLRGRPTYNLEFVEVGKELGAPPNPEIVFEEIVTATVELDDARLEELEAKERASHQRPLVLKSIKHARKQIRGRA